MTSFLSLCVGPVCEEPEPTGVSGPAGGAVLQIWEDGQAPGALPGADWEDEGSGFHHSARWES